MRTSATLFILVGVILVTMTSGGCGKASDREPAERLPDLVPQAEDISEQYSRPLSYIVDEEGQYTSDRRGYSVRYLIGPPQAGPLSWARAGTHVLAAVEVYDDDIAAQQALESEPEHTSGDPISSPMVGDASIAWPRRTANEEPSCPCEFRFRVRHIVGTVGVSRGGPVITYDGVDPNVIALAEMMSLRIRDALA
jgi:hypothetical protein